MIINPFSKHYVIPSFISKDRSCEIIDKANSFGKWTFKRHNNYPTTDIPVDDIPELNVNDELEKIIDICKNKYQLEPESIITPFDIFVVKYDAKGKNKLDLHNANIFMQMVIL